jgi:opacity protein-like surface antigen
VPGTIAAALAFRTGGGKGSEVRYLFATAMLGMLAISANPAAAETSTKGGLYLRSDSAATLPAPSAGLAGATVGDGSNAVLLGAGGGYRFTPSFGAGATLSYVPSLKFSGLDLSGIGTQGQNDARPVVGMVNGYFDLAAAAGLGWSVQPFVIGGIGVSHELGGLAMPSGGGPHTDLAWGAGAGIGIPIGGMFSLDVTYRYLDLGQMRFGSASAGAAGGRSDLQVHSATVGVRLGF